MDARHWLGSEAALYSRAFDAARAIDALAASTAVEHAVKSAAGALMLDHQSIVARATLYSSGYNELSAIAAGHTRALDGVGAANRAIANAMHATTLHSALLEATNALQGAVTWREVQQSIAGLAAGQNVMLWDDMNRLAKTSGAGAYALHQLSRIRDFDRALSGIISEAAGAAWSTHLRAGALPALSFLAQDWSRPLGLMTALEQPESGASVAWLTLHRGTPTLMMAAITPNANTNEGLEVTIEDEMLCVLCKNPILPVTTGYRWIGPRRAVRQHFFPPACPTCAATESQDPGFLYRALCELTRPRFAVIRGNRQGDGRPRGRLYLVRDDSDQDE